MKLSLALLAGAASAYSSCSNDWYFQEGKSYTYDLTSKLDGHLEFFDGGVPASKGRNSLGVFLQLLTKISVLTGQVSVNTLGDCDAEIHLTSRMGARSQTLISGLINYGDDGLNYVRFDASNSEAQNNIGKIVLKTSYNTNKKFLLNENDLPEKKPLQGSPGSVEQHRWCQCFQ